jgi:hypothetical protein
MGGLRLGLAGGMNVDLVFLFGMTSLSSAVDNADLKEKIQVV